MLVAAPLVEKTAVSPAAGPKIGAPAPQLFPVRQASPPPPPPPVQKNVAAGQDAAHIAAIAAKQKRSFLLSANTRAKLPSSRAALRQD